MILSDRDIKKAIAAGRIRILPEPDLAETLGPCAVDFRLSSTFRTFRVNHFPVIDPRNKAMHDDITEVITIEGDRPFIIHPGEFVIASTIEWLELSDDLIGRLEGRSSLARMGVMVHSTAARFDPGWKGNAVLELGNLGRMPVALYPGMRICAFTFEQLSSPAEISYTKRKSSKYVDQRGPSESGLSKELAGEPAPPTTKPFI
ncbi:MAG: dCTP deaminase [bacterium]|nr:dCTP deaminase [bacterium]